MVNLTWDKSDFDEANDEAGVAHHVQNTLSQGYSHDKDLTRGLIGWWPLNWTGSKVPDLSGNGNHGTNNGSTGNIAGKSGMTAHYFDGSSTYISTPGGLPDVGTITAWVKVNTADSNGQIVSNQSNSKDGWNIQVSASNSQFRSSIGDNSGWNGYDFGAIQLDEWQFVCVTYDGTTSHGYVDGQQNNSNTGTLSSSTENIYIGREPHGSWNDYLDATVSDVRVYNRVLSQDEITTLYKWGSADLARPPTDGISYYPMDGDATDNWSSNDGTVNGATLSSGGGIRGGCYSFNGTSDYISTSSFNDSSVTLSAWVYANTLDTGSNNRVYHSHNNVTLFHNSSNEWSWTIDNGSFINNTTTTKTASTAEWIHFVGTYDGSESVLYINGAKDSSIVTSGNIVSPSSSDCAVGAFRDGSTQYFDGKIDELRLYNRALSPQEVQRLYQYGTKGINMNKKLVNH